MSYQLKLDPKSRKAARFISSLQNAIQKALAESGKTQQQIAELLQVDRSVINRRLKGSSNLTARSIAEFAFALDKDVTINFVERVIPEDANWPAAMGNIVEIQQKGISVPKGTIKPNQTFNLERAAL